MKTYNVVKTINGHHAGQVLSAHDKIKTLNQLADYINGVKDGYDNEVVEAACEVNGWNVGEDEWHIADDGKEQVLFDDDCVAIVTPID